MRIFFALLAPVFAALLAASCGGKTRNTTPTATSLATDELKLKGDKTVYGLVCEGTSDSALVLFPNDGSDPITYNTLQAHRRNKVLGHLKTGDWVGVVLNNEDPKRADLVIDLDELKGIWCYIVMPKLKEYGNTNGQTQRESAHEMPDSVLNTYMIPREYGFWLQRQWSCQSVGYIRNNNTLDDDSPVTYPPLGYFTAWHIWNGKLVLTRGTPKMAKDNAQIEVTDLVYDTCNIDYLGKDSLVLSDGVSSRSYYRKDNVGDVNKKAKSIAAIMEAKALSEATQN